jgi:hypothetical protein
MRLVLALKTHKQRAPNRCYRRCEPDVKQQVENTRRKVAAIRP